MFTLLCFYNFVIIAKIVCCLTFSSHTCISSSCDTTILYSLNNDSSLHVHVSVDRVVHYSTMPLHMLLYILAQGLHTLSACSVQMCVYIVNSHLHRMMKNDEYTSHYKHVV